MYPEFLTSYVYTSFQAEIKMPKMIFYIQILNIDIVRIKFIREIYKSFIYFGHLRNLINLSQYCRLT